MTLTGTGLEFHLGYLRSTVDQCGDRWLLGRNLVSPPTFQAADVPHKDVTNSAHPGALVGPEMG